MELPIIHSASGAPQGRLVVADEVFARPFNEPLVHQVVVAYLAGARAGTRAQKNRSDVRGGGVKPWRQKGTGRARAGSSRSPLWRGGGVTFAARPRDYSQKINRKMYRGAMRAIFSELLRQNRLRVIDALALPEVKTKRMVACLATWGIADLRRILLVGEEVNLNLYLSARNLPNVAISDVAGLDPVSLIGAEIVLITAGAMQRVGEWLA